MASLTSYYDTAMTTLAKVGLNISPKESASSLVIPLVERLERVDPENALSIARTMQISGEFNELVLTEISSLEIGGRFTDIAIQFDSIRDDTKQMVEFMDDGKLDWKERIHMSWMKLRRGTVTDRFSDIKATFTDVIAGTTQQLEKESLVLDAYQNFRFAIKEAERAAASIFQRTKDNLEQSKLTAAESDKQIATATDDLERSSLELARDTSLAAVKQAEDDFQLAKDLFENLKISYSTSEVVFARLQQNLDMKKRIQQRSVTFFSTNETVFTALAAAFTSTQGLAESTNALEMMQSGVNKSIEALATVGTKQLEASARAGYGATISAQSVKALASSIVEYQSTLTSMVDQLRDEATRNALEIEQYTNDAKSKFVTLTTKA
jgi:hypothetical protein